MQCHLSVFETGGVLLLGASDKSLAASRQPPDCRSTGCDQTSPRGSHAEHNCGEGIPSRKGHVVIAMGKAYISKAHSISPSSYPLST